VPRSRNRSPVTNRSQSIYEIGLIIVNKYRAKQTSKSRVAGRSSPTRAVEAVLMSAIGESAFSARAEDGAVMSMDRAELGVI